jgi:hypothetical protein
MCQTKFRRNKEFHYVLIMETIHHENTYIQNDSANNYKKQVVLDVKGQIDSNSIIVCDFKPHSQKVRS